MVSIGVRVVWTEYQSAVEREFVGGEEELEIPKNQEKEHLLLAFLDASTVSYVYVLREGLCLEEDGLWGQ